MTEPPHRYQSIDEMVGAAPAKKQAAPPKKAPAKKKAAPRKKAAPAKKAVATPAPVEEPVDNQWKEHLLVAWQDSQWLTPRQAAAFLYLLDGWADEMDDYVDEPLHERRPFRSLDLRVTMLVHDNAAWVAKVQERCRAVARELEQGVLPFERRGCYFDEVLMALCLLHAPAMLVDMPFLFDDFPERMPEENEGEFQLGDEDWDCVGDTFDDEAWWGDWEVPVFRDHVLLGGLLQTRPPTTWFDLLLEPLSAPDET